MGSPGTGGGPTAALCAFAAGLRHADLTDHDRRSVRRHLLDTLGAMIAGASGTPSRIAAGVLAENGCSGDVPVPGFARRTDRLTAAYLGGASAHGLELDDGFRAGSVHPGAPVIPAVLAAAYGTGVSGARVSAAIAVGYELTTRIAAAGHPGSRNRGFHNTSITGVLGATAAVGSLLGMDTNAIEHALGIAASSACGLFAFLQGGGQIKRLHPGMAAREGLYAALLARAGMTGPRSVLEGRDGFFQAYSGSAKLALLIDGLDPSEGLNVGRCYMKPYACCRHIHPAIDGVINILAAEALPAAEIERIEAGTYAIASEHAHGSWGDMATAQLSYQFCVATAARRARVDIADFDDAALTDEATQSLARRIAVSVDPEREASYPASRSAGVAVLARDGRRFETLIDEPRGSAKYPLSDEQVAAKFLTLAGPVLGGGGAEALVRLVGRLEDLAGLEALIDGAAPRA